MRAALLAIVLALAAAPAIAKPSRADPIPLKKGLPHKEGLSRLVIVSNLAGRDARFQAVKKLAEIRDAKILKFKEGKVETVRKALARAGPEFVAFAVSPETVDINFHFTVLELCRDLDADPMPDFYFGYLCARDGPDMETLVAGILRREQARPERPNAKIVGMSGDGSHLAPLDYLLHFGHGQAWRVDKGLTGQQVGALRLPRAPVVFSGACFNGVLSRSYHKCSRQLVFFKPTTIDPAHLMTLNWVHAGASAYLAALEADRGEMANAEWEYFREHACSLGEVIGYQYRLAFVSVYADFTKFPRYIPGRRKRMGFYDVMLRGMVSRILLSDPSFRPLAAPLDQPVHSAEANFDAVAGTLTVTANAVRWAQGYVNYLPKSKKGIFDRRLYVRVPLSTDVPANKLEPPAVEARNGPELVELTRFHVRHEVWGGRRYLNLQAEAPAGQIKTGTRITYVFPAK